MSAYYFDFDVDYNYSLDTLSKELNSIFPDVGDYAIYPIGPAGGNTYVRVYAEEYSKIRAFNIYLKQKGYDFTIDLLSLEPIFTQND